MFSFIYWGKLSNLTNLCEAKVYEPLLWFWIYLNFEFEFMNKIAPWDVASHFQGGPKKHKIQNITHTYKDIVT